jgi:hypothetical protein
VGIIYRKKEKRWKKKKEKGGDINIKGYICI